jgi:hypothetical protein
MSQSQLRDILRYSHLAAGIVLGVIVYSPLIDEDGGLWVLRLAVVPFLVLGGAWMFIQSLRWSAAARPDER